MTAFATNSKKIPYQREELCEVLEYCVVELRQPAQCLLHVGQPVVSWNLLKQTIRFDVICAIAALINMKFGTWTAATAALSLTSNRTTVW